MGRGVESTEGVDRAGGLEKLRERGALLRGEACLLLARGEALVLLLQGQGREITRKVGPVG